MIKEYLEYFNKNEPQAPMMLMKLIKMYLHVHKNKINYPKSDGIKSSGLKKKIK